MRGGLEKSKLVSSDYPCQRNKHCRIPCTHVNLDHSKCEVLNQNLYDRWHKLVICQSNNDSCSVDFANQKYKPLFFMNELLIALFKQGNQLTSVNAGNYAKPFIKQTWMQLS